MSRKVAIIKSRSVGISSLIVDALHDVGEVIEPIPRNELFVDIQKSMMETIERAQRDIIFGPKPRTPPEQVKFESTQPYPVNDWVKDMWGNIPIKHERHAICYNIGDWQPKPETNLYAYAWENHKKWISNHVST